MWKASQYVHYWYAILVVMSSVAGTVRSLSVKNLDTKPSRVRKAPAKKAASKKRAEKQPAKKATKKVAVKKLAAKKKPTAIKAVANKSPSAKQPIAKTFSTKEINQILKRDPLGHLLVEQKLTEAGFRGTVSTDRALLDKYSMDESIFAIRPQIVVQPRRAADVEIAVQVLGEYTRQFSSLSLTPRAAGTGLSGGSLTDSVVIDVLTHLHKINPVSESKSIVTITCEPGAMLRDVEKKLKRVDHYLPCYPASKDICAIGGCVANNAAGPDSLRHGHFANWVESLDVVLNDGHTYTIAPLTYKELKALTKKQHAYAQIARDVFALIEKNEKEIKSARPKTKKNTARFNLWDVINTSVAEFKKGVGTFDLTQVISGSQGTLGIITSITLRAEPIAKDTSLIVVPVFDLADASDVVVSALEYDPINIEIFDGLTFNLALKNPQFFKSRLRGIQYYQVMLAMYMTYHITYGGKTPEFTLLVTLDNKSLKSTSPQSVVEKLRGKKNLKARLIQPGALHEMYWQVRRASYTLSKFEDTSKRPAAFLEDMTVPPQNLGKFFTEIKALLKKYNVTAAVHGHGGNGHFHFYPLLDFTSPATAQLVERMTEEFFNTAIRHGGNICGEHNDGIIRTPHLSKMYSKKILDLFATLEHIFDPDDIFNPGKKVNPRFDIKESLRKIN